MTEMGVILGTAAYMSPEQAKGRPADKRSDVWAFGCVLFEMLTGEAVFDRGTIAEVMAAILEREPEWQRLPRTAPQPLRDLLRWCLQKDMTRRLRDIGDAGPMIMEAMVRLNDRDPEVSPTASRSLGVARWTAAAGWVVAGLLVAVLVGLRSVPGRSDTASRAVMRMTTARRSWRAAPLTRSSRLARRHSSGTPAGGRRSSLPPGSRTGEAKPLPETADVRCLLLPGWRIGWLTAANLERCSSAEGWHTTWSASEIFRPPERGVLRMPSSSPDRTGFRESHQVGVSP